MLESFSPSEENYQNDLYDSLLNETIYEVIALDRLISWVKGVY